MMVHTSWPSVATSEDSWHYQNRIQHHQPYHEHRQHLYQQQQQPIGILPERSLHREEWKVAGRGREVWKVASTPQPSKPLPQEPPMPPPRRSFGGQQQHQFDYWHHPAPPSQLLPQQQQSTAWSCHVDEAYETDRSSATGDSMTSTDTADDSSPAIALEKKNQTAEKKSKDTNMDNTKRQITVQSINVEHKVWIDIDTTETGLTLARKIHNIATFRTRKIVSITTTAGRTIPLDHRPVFGSWMDMDDFKNGEEWKVGWCELDRSFVDRFVSRFIQVSGSSRRR